MRASPRARRRWYRFIPALLALAWAAEGEAQVELERTFGDGLRGGVGYTAVMPDAMLGVGGFYMPQGRRWGLFVDAKRTGSSVTGRSDYCPPPARPPNLESCTAAAVGEEWNDVLVKTLEEHSIVNAGGVIPLTDEFAILLGVGVARSREIHEFAEMVGVDEDWRVSDNGSYFAPVDVDARQRIQGVAGMLFRAGDRLAVRFGYETAPGGISVGAYLVF